MTQKQDSQITSRCSFTDWYENFQAQQTLKRIENIKRGLFRREDKIQLLEAELYNRIQDDDEIVDVLAAIEVLQTNKVQDEELYQKQQNSVVAQLNGLIAFGIAVGIAATVFSFIATPFCGKSQSRFCVGARVIPDAIASQFGEPVNQKPELIPAPLKD